VIEDAMTKLFRQLYGQLFRWIVLAAVIGFVVTALSEYLHAGQVLFFIGQQLGQPD
jgi:hypothetical protein